MCGDTAAPAVFCSHMQGLPVHSPWEPLALQSASRAFHQQAQPRVGGGHGPGLEGPHRVLFLLSALQELQLDSDPGVWKAALETLKILDSCSQHRLLASPKGTS